MAEIRVRARAEADGELHLRGLPIQKGREAEVIVLTEPPDAAVLDVLRHDPGWAWLWEEAEDLYTPDDLKP
ncbi:MAG TPA: hypothetical protein VG370_24210 [Chloroflexota bacterium]|jgi:hypothetical protein|nr:hypothetical protein [Chloroflexota bacterium]